MDPISAVGMVTSALGAKQSKRANMLGLGLNMYQNYENRKATFRENERSRKFAIDQYVWERNDKREDRDFENQYNSPMQQMKRLKEAGLNPRLFYGSSTGMLESASTKAPSTNQPHTQAPQYDFTGSQRAIEGLGGVLGKFFELQQLQASTDNTRALKDLADANAKATLAGIPKTQVETDAAKYNLDWLKKTESRRSELQTLEIEKIREEIENISKSTEGRNAEIQVMLDRRDMQKIETNIAQARFNLDKRQAAQDLLYTISQRMKTDAERVNVSEQRTILLKQSQILTHERTIKALEGYMKGKELDYYELNMFLKAVGISVAAYAGTKGLSGPSPKGMISPTKNWHTNQTK